MAQPEIPPERAPSSTRNETWSRALTFLCLARLPLLLLGAGFTLPIFLLWKPNPLLSNLLVTESRGALVLLVFLAFFPAWIAGLAVHLVVHHGVERFGVEPPRRWREWAENPLFVLGASSAGAAPTIVALVVCSHVNGVGANALALVGGLALAALCFALLVWTWKAYVGWVERGGGLELVDRVAQWMSLFGPGYVDPRGRMARGHFPAFLILVVVGVLSLLLRAWTHPERSASDGWLPIFPILILAALLASLLPALAFLLDRWRVPLLTVLAAWLTVAPALLALVGVDSDPRFDLHAEHEWIPAPPDAPLRDTSGRLDPNAPIVVVCAAGGGIRAAAWTAIVLTGLEERLGSEFLRSIRLVTGVSGGSVGLMHYLVGFQRDEPRSPATLERMRHGAARSSLLATTWGITYLDFPRFLFPFRVGRDRGWAQERAWARHLAGDGAPAEALRFSDWCAATSRGALPGVVFQSTLVESGQPIFLSSVDLVPPGESGATSVVESFSEHFGGRDLEQVTAARLSATFPFVSPSPRARLTDGEDPALPAEHFADGGYYENFGIAAAALWLQRLDALLARRDADAAPIVLLRIDPFTPAEVDPPWTLGWLNELFAPLRAVLAARGTSQRALGELLLARSNSAGGPRILQLTVRPEVPRDAQGADALLGSETLSWHLTDDERERLAAIWTLLLQSASDPHPPGETNPRDSVEALEILQALF